MIDNIFSPDYQYYKGQYCVYNNTLYRAKTDIPVGTPFSTDNWEYRQIGLDLYSLSSSLTNTNTDLQNLISQIDNIHWLQGVSNIYNFLRNTSNPNGLYLATCQNATDNPFSGNVTLGLIYKATANGSYSVCFLIAGNRLAISDQLGTTQTALTWHSKVSPFG